MAKKKIDKPAHRYKFDIAISLLDSDLPYAESLFTVFNEYELSIFLYPRNQGDIANRNGMNVFIKTFREDARLVVLLYRKGYGDTRFTRIEHSAIQERYLNEGADFCVLVPMDGNRPEWYPGYQIYTSNKMSPEEVAGLILHKLADRGGELKERSFEEYIRGNMDIWRKKAEHYQRLKERDTFPLIAAQMDGVRHVFGEKEEFLRFQHLPFGVRSWGLEPGLLDCIIALKTVGIRAYYTPRKMNIPQGNCQSYTLHIDICRFMDDRNFDAGEVFFSGRFKLNIDDSGEIGWSEVIVLDHWENHQVALIDYQDGYYYELGPAIYHTTELLESWFREFIKKVFEVHRL